MNATQIKYLKERVESIERDLIYKVSQYTPEELELKKKAQALQDQACAIQTECYSSVRQRKDRLSELLAVKRSKLMDQIMFADGLPEIQKLLDEFSATTIDPEF